jgi:hypothetical protein
MKPIARPYFPGPEVAGRCDRSEWTVSMISSARPDAPPGQTGDSPAET